MATARPTARAADLRWESRSRIDTGKVLGSRAEVGLLRVKETPRRSPRRRCQRRAEVGNQARRLSTTPKRRNCRRARRAAPRCPSTERGHIHDDTTVVVDDPRKSKLVAGLLACSSASSGFIGSISNKTLGLRSCCCSSSACADKVLVGLRRDGVRLCRSSMRSGSSWIDQQDSQGLPRDSLVARNDLKHFEIGSVVRNSLPSVYLRRMISSGLFTIIPEPIAPSPDIRNVSGTAATTCNPYAGFIHSDGADVSGRLTLSQAQPTSFGGVAGRVTLTIFDTSGTLQDDAVGHRQGNRSLHRQQ